MTIVNKEFIDFAEKEIVAYVMKFSSGMEESKASQVAKEIVKLIDWNNSALMHKGLSWMAKNYLIKQNMI